MIGLQVFILAWVLGLFLSPLCAKLAARLGIVDLPDGHRKLHRGPVPLAGGMAIFSAAIAALLIPTLYNSSWRWQLAQEAEFLGGLFLSVCTIFVVGLLDDRFKIRGRQKLIGQCVAALVVVLTGLKIDEFSLFGGAIWLGMFAIPFTMFWLVCAVNALNLIDGVDGLATSVGIILSLTFAALAALTNHWLDCAIALTVAGSLCGFLYFNWPPARMFLGDSGSMLVGLVLGTMAMRSSLKGPTTVAMAAPLAAWAVLFFDVGMAVLRRKLTGQSIYATDRGHLHHVIQKKGFTSLGTVTVIALLCVVCGIGSLISVYLKSEILAVISSLSVLAALVATRFFGHSEVWLLSQRAQRFIASFFRLPSAKEHRKNPLCSRFQGQREWERLWESLVDFAERFDICVVQLNVNSPAIGEEYHALWERKEEIEEFRQWTAKIPLYSQSLNVGQLMIRGTIPHGTPFEWMSELLEGLKPFELQLMELLQLEESASGSVQLEPTSH